MYTLQFSLLCLSLFEQLLNAAGFSKKRLCPWGEDNLWALSGYIPSPDIIVHFDSQIIAARHSGSDASIDHRLSSPCCKWLLPLS